MKKHLTVFTTIFCLLLVVSCSRKKEVAAKPVKDFPSIQNILPIQLPSEINLKGKTDDFEVLETHQDGGFLIVKVAYSGGCNEHFFEASWDERYMKSLPPQVNVSLTHVNNDDACRARIEKEVAIDLRKLFLNTPNNVVVILNGNVERKIIVSPHEYGFQGSLDFCSLVLERLNYLHF
jgi:hypothetical protein